MEAMEELIQLSESMLQAAALLADEDADEPSSKRNSTFLNVVALGNVVSRSCPDSALVISFYGLVIFSRDLI